MYCSLFQIPSCKRDSVFRLQQCFDIFKGLLGQRFLVAAGAGGCRRRWCYGVPALPPALCSRLLTPVLCVRHLAFSFVFLKLTSKYKFEFGSSVWPVAVFSFENPTHRAAGAQRTEPPRTALTAALSPAPAPTPLPLAVLGVLVPAPRSWRAQRPLRSSCARFGQAATPQRAAGRGAAAASAGSSTIPVWKRILKNPDWEQGIFS